MKLYLLRHGDAKVGGVDHIRELSERGIRDVQDIARKFKELNFKIGTIFHSDLKRAQDTAKIFKNHLNISCTMEEKENLRPSGPIQYWIDRLDHEDEVLLVGHMPFLADLATELLNYPTSFYTANLLILEKDSVETNWKLLYNFHNQS